MDYCTSLYYEIKTSDLNRLQWVLNPAARVVSQTGYTDHISHVLSDLHWLKIPESIHFKIAVLTIKCLNGLAPSYLSDMVHAYNPSRKLRSVNANTLVQPKYNLKCSGFRRFSVAAPTVWNEIPHEIRTCDTLMKFRKKLKAHLFTKSFGK